MSIVYKRFVDCYGGSADFTTWICSRPQNVARVINEPFAAGVIYPAVLSAWVFFALHFARPQANPWVPIFGFIIGCVGTLIYGNRLKKDFESRDKARTKDSQLKSQPL